MEMLVTDWLSGCDHVLRFEKEFSSSLYFDLFLDASLNSCVKSVMQIACFRRSGSGARAKSKASERAGKKPEQAIMQKSARLFLIGGCIDS